MEESRLRCTTEPLLTPLRPDYKGKVCPEERRTVGLHDVGREDLWGTEGVKRGSGGAGVERIEEHDMDNSMGAATNETATGGVRACPRAHAIHSGNARRHRSRSHVCERLIIRRGDP